MRTISSFYRIRNALISLILIASCFFSSIQNAFAIVDRVRDTSINGNGQCKTKKIGFDPFSSNPDILWEIDNPVCLSYMLGAALAVFTAEQISSAACMNFSEGAIAAAERAAGVGLSPDMVKRRAKEATKCASLVSAGNYGQAGLCCGGMSATVAATGLAVAALSVIWQAAVDSQQNAHLCGETWNTWEERPAAQKDESDGEGISNYQQSSLPDDTFYIYGKRNHSYQKTLEQLATTQFASVSGFDLNNPIKTKEYREYIYGGIEYEDNDGSYDAGDDAASLGGGGCPLPKWKDEDLDTILGYHSGKQRYYMRGPKVASNYACGRFLLHKGTKDEKNSGRAAYECCKQRSQETICIEEGNALNASSSSTANLNTKHQFCKVGERCKVQNVWYEIHPAKEHPNYICATTYSVCPYNHNLGGGTEIAEYSPEHQDILLNHCQYLKHCTKKPDVPYIRTSDLDGGWIDGACFDMQGDSQNNYDFNVKILQSNTKNFSAPIAQCFKETLENVFINKAGYTKCLDPDESPDKNDVCNSGYYFKKGNIIDSQKSFFQSIQDNLQTAIKMVMTIAICVMGIGVLLTGTPWKKQDIMKFVVKLGLVAFFALGSAWQNTFFTGVSRSSMALADIFMKVDLGVEENQRDGCQFPKYNAQIMKDTGEMDATNPAYPQGKEYLAIWDMLDCKIARSMGFGLEASVPNLFYMILAGFLTGGAGIVFFVGVFIFAFYLFALTIRALHIFLISSVAITILIYVSPITITSCLFKRTEGIFTRWRTNLLSFVLQPVILFCYLGILITIFEKTVIGDATFSGDGIKSPKQIVCSTGNAANNSIYCIFKIKDVKTINSLAPLGIGLPVLFNMNSEKIATITKGAFLMFIFTKFLDKITGFAATLVGGAALSSGSMGAIAALGKAYGMTGVVQSRGKNALQKWGGKAVKGIGSKVRSGVGGAGKAASAVADRRKANAENSGSRVPNSSPTSSTSTPKTSSSSPPSPSKTPDGR